MHPVSQVIPISVKMPEMQTTIVQFIIYGPIRNVIQHFFNMAYILHLGITANQNLPLRFGVLNNFCVLVGAQLRSFFLQKRS